MEIWTWPLEGGELSLDDVDVGGSTVLGDDGFADFSSHGFGLWVYGLDVVMWVCGYDCVFVSMCVCVGVIVFMWCLCDCEATRSRRQEVLGILVAILKVMFMSCGDVRV